MPSTKAHCNSCSENRNHEILHSVGTTWENAEFGLCGGNTYQTLKCCGCEDIKLRYSSFTDDDDESANVRYFPPKISRRAPNWFCNLRLNLKADDAFVEVLLNEIYVAFQNNLSSLSTMGIRALLEKIMISKVEDKGTFKEKTAKFEALGHVSTLQRERLDTILEAGHAAMHREYTPELKDVITLLDITEHIVATVFLHETNVAYLKTKIPAKKRKDPSSSVGKVKRLPTYVCIRQKQLCRPYTPTNGRNTRIID